MAASVVPIPFPLSSAPGRHPQESAGRLINGFGEPLGDTAASDRVYRRVPGLRAFGTTTRTGFRGAAEINGTLYSAWSGRLVKHTAAGGAAADIGALNGTRRGFFARNNATTPDQVFVDPDGNVATFTSSTVTNGYPDADLPSPNSVTSIDGYLVFGIGDGRVFATDLNTTAVNPLSFARGEARPDGLVRVVTSGSVLVLMGAYTSEVWTNVGTSPFPFQRSTVLDYGLIGPYAVAGHEDQMSKGLVWVAHDSTVVRLTGYQVDKVSPPDLDRLIEAVADKSTLEATAYMAGGHAMWELSCPAWTWVLDLGTGQWHERRAHQATRSRIAGAVPAFGRWLAGDTASGHIVEITTAAHRDVTAPLPMRIESGPVSGFPNRQRIARADFRFAVGVGVAAGLDPIETDPTVEIAWSDDGGLSWSAPLRRSLGHQARGDTRITLFNTGIAGPYGRRWRLDIADPVYVGFMGATMSAEARSG